MNTQDFLMQAALAVFPQTVEQQVYGGLDAEKSAWAHAEALLQAAPKAVRDELTKNDGHYSEHVALASIAYIAENQINR